MRPEITEGEIISIEGFEFIVTEPRDEMALTLSDDYMGDSEKNLIGCKVLPEKDNSKEYEKLPGCVDVIKDSRIVRTSVDLTEHIMNGETARIKDFESTVMSPRDEFHFSMAANYTGESEKCLEISKRKAGWEAGLIPLSGTVSCKNNGKTCFTTNDLRSEINLKDIIIIGGLKFHVSSPFDANSLDLSSIWPNPSQSGLKAFKQADIVKLGGTISVVNGSPTVTTTIDLRSEIAPGDIVKILDNQFEVITPQNSVTFTLTVPYPGVTASGLNAYKVVGSRIALSGLFTVNAGSINVETTTDIRNQIGPGDVIEIAGQKRTISGSMAPGLFTVEIPYITSAKLVPGYKVGKSADRITLEALALEKLKCKTIFCLAKLEQQERGIPFPLPRNLGGGADGKKAAISALEASGNGADKEASFQAKEEKLKDGGEEFAKWLKSREDEIGPN